MIHFGGEMNSILYGPTIPWSGNGK